jgi:hypothetical protein
MEPVKIFYSYAHKDETLRRELGNHLANCRRQRICEDWHDGLIVAGQSWDEIIREKLRTSDFILLLVSADFLASNYIDSVELQEAMRQHQERKVRVIPIMLRPCDVSGAVFSKLQGLPSKLKPVTSWSDQDEAWTDVVKGLKLAFAEFQKSSNGAKDSPTSGVEEPPEIQKAAPASTQPLNLAQEENRILAATSTRAIQGLGELMANPRIRAFVAEEQDEFIAAESALQVLVDYKNVHDRLHDLQFKCYNYIFQEGRKLEDEIDWPLLDQPQKDLASITDALEEAAKQGVLAEEDFDWLTNLREAGRQLSAAANDLSIAPLQEAARIIRSILEVRPPIFDTKLCAAAKTLPLQDLRRALLTVRDKMNPNSLKSDAGTRFRAGVDALPQLSANLETLTLEHTRWQVIATTFWSIDALIDQNFDALRKSWPKLRERLEKICAANPARWATSILESARKLDELLAAPPAGTPKDLQRWQTKVRQTYTSCSNDGGTRFYQVDLSLKRLCEELREVQMALASVLQELP